MSTFGWECREDVEVEEWVTQFWSNKGQEPTVELVMRRVNEDGSVGDWQDGWGAGVERKVGEFLRVRERERETVRANELDLLETWHSAHGAHSISLLC